MPTNIHPSAVIDPNARIAESVRIGPNTVIEADVSIDEGTVIGSSCLLDNGARIGKNCSIHHGAVLGSPPQDLKYMNEKTELFVGDNTTIREYCTLNRGTTHSYKSSVGKNCLLMAYAHVAHDCIIGDNVILANAVQMGGHTEIDDFAIIGGSSVIHQFCRVGAHVMMSGGIGTAKDIPPYALAGTLPAKFAGLNSIGLRRRGFAPETITIIHEVYKAVYYSGMNVSQSIEFIKQNFEMIPEVQYIVDFISNSKRGIIPVQK